MGSEKLFCKGGGCTAKLGMNGKDHVKKGLPILEDKKENKEKDEFTRLFFQHNSTYNKHTSAYTKAP